MIWWIELIIGMAVGLGWLSFGALLAAFVRNQRLNKCAAPLPEPAQWPPVSVIIPARNEGDNIAATIQSLLDTNYPSLEIIAINDRSDDNTGRIIDRFAAEDSRLTVLHIKDLPDDWLGKNHAIYKASQIAGGNFLLITDGDVLFSETVIRLTITYCMERKLDHLVLMPENLPGGFWENAAVAFFSLMFFMGIQPRLVPGRFKRFYAGAGAFNFVRRSAYEAVGGHKTLRLEVVEDLGLGRLIKLFGFRQDILLSDGHVRVRWVNTVSGFIRALEKNAFASMDFSICRLLSVTFLLAGSMMLPYLGIILFHDLRAIGYALAVLLMHTMLAYVGSKAHAGWKAGFVFPVPMLIFLWAYWRSAMITLRRGGVRWRDSFYPLEILRSRIRPDDP